MYSEGEFDVLIVVRPEHITNSFDENNDILVIPESSLRDVNNPGFLLRNVTKKMETSFRSLNAHKTPKGVIKQVLENV